MADHSFAAPFLLYFIGQFLLPALTPREKRFHVADLFAAGAVALRDRRDLLLRIRAKDDALQFFFGYSEYLGFGATWTAKALIDFEVQMLLGFGLAFEFPLVILVLNLLGIVSAAQLASKRRHAAFFIFIAACCIIPSTDLFSLSVLSVPMYLLYESCIWIARIMERKKAAPSIGPRRTAS